MDSTNCYHCGDRCDAGSIVFDQKEFCCYGCKTVYEIFRNNDLSYYYDLQEAAGATPKEIEGKYDFLDNTDIVERLIDFQDGDVEIVTLLIPHIHCSSCIWILENLNKLLPAVISSQVDFPKKKLQVSYHSEKLNLKALVGLLVRIGYEPHISLDDYTGKKSGVDRSLIYKLGVAGFAFGNIMFLSFPEYLDLNSSGAGGEEFWLGQYKYLFRWLMFAFSLPVVFYAASDYFISALKGLRSKFMNIDVPIALGISVLFIRSTYDISLDWGPGFFDSLTGLVFFLLIGRFFQQKTYSFLSFERDYKSYFPIAVTRINRFKKEENIAVYKINAGDRLLIRNREIIPVDSVLISDDAQIDYSFVTGESQAVLRQSGDRLYAGGRQINSLIEIEALKSVSQSYLTQLWSNKAFQKNSPSQFQTLTNSIGKRFTLAVLTIAFIATGFWLYWEPSKALDVFTAVLIIACPCAIALSAPFTLGNMLRIFGRRRFYLKNAEVIERLAKVDTSIFDKTGTLTSTLESNVCYNGVELSKEEASMLKSTLRASNHPLSRTLYRILNEQNIYTLDEFNEELGKGIESAKNNKRLRIGSAEFVGGSDMDDTEKTSVHISYDNNYKGCFAIHNVYREGVFEALNEIGHQMDIALLSGDNAGEKPQLEKQLPPLTPMYFKQSPEDKLNFVRSLQKKGRQVLMVGDGLNDAGALAQSDVGLAISEDINVFSPACDAILDASKFRQLYKYIKASKKAMSIIKLSFVLSLVYNIIGLYFAVTGQLAPVIAAILMPLSSISIVGFTTLATNLSSKNLN
ncbi:MAG: heavy metal translocating P-type ATPase metal-binding domain-containing protein [Flavobacteriaceae bacterium]